jgi:hypothetical protein
MKGNAVSMIDPSAKAGEISSWLEQLQAEVGQLDHNVGRMASMLSPVCNYRGNGSEGMESPPESELCPVAERIRSVTKALRIFNGRLETQMEAIEL